MSFIIILFVIIGCVAIFELLINKRPRLHPVQKPKIQTTKPQNSQPSQQEHPQIKETRGGLIFRMDSYNLIYRPIEEQIIYIEGCYDERVNSFIQQHYDSICAHFQSRGYVFCYLPYMIPDNVDEKIIDYYAPYRTDNKEPSDNDDLFFGKFEKKYAHIGPSLLFYKKEFGLMRITINLDDKNVKDDFSHLLNAICWYKNNYNKEVRYSLRDNHAMYSYVAAEYSDTNTMTLIREIEERVALLAQRGIDELILQQIVAKPQVVSRMIITRDYRIILPDYNDMEIEMTPLVKAVYFLFLLHPEGIVFKYLIDYRNELKKIYRVIKGEKLNDKMKQSIEDITDPTKNSINEKCARIREAFVTRFDERLAVNYIVSGNRGESKRIPLNRDFVEWQ